MLSSLLSSLKSRKLEAIKHTQAPKLILAGTGAHWQDLYRESKFKLNTLHLQEFKAKEDKKAKQAEKKRYSEFIDLYEEYLKYSNFITSFMPSC